MEHLELLDRAREAWVHGLAATKAQAADLIIEFRRNNPDAGWRAIADRCRIVNEATGEPYTAGWYASLVKWRTGNPGDVPEGRPFSGATPESKGRGAVEARKVLADRPEAIVPELADALQRAEVRHAVIAAKPDLLDALVRDPATARQIQGAQLRHAAELGMERQFAAPARGEGAPSPAQPPSPWQALFAGFGHLAVVMDRLTPDSWSELGASQLERIAEDAARYSELLGALAGAASEKLPESSRKAG